ncbi:hypothetical protein OROMI_009393 [Orobanche minor]
MNLRELGRDSIFRRPAILRDLGREPSGDRIANVPRLVSKLASRHPVQDLQHGRVSAAEFVQAVHEMLSSAGINLDMEKQSLLEAALTLQEQLKESQAALLLEQKKSLKRLSKKLTQQKQHGLAEYARWQFHAVHSVESKYRKQFEYFALDCCSIKIRGC